MYIFSAMDRVKFISILKGNFSISYQSSIFNIFQLFTGIANFDRFYCLTSPFLVLNDTCISNQLVRIIHIIVFFSLIRLISTNIITNKNFIAERVDEVTHKKSFFFFNDTPRNCSF